MDSRWILLFTFLLFIEFVRSQINDCTTPDGNDGHCILARDCGFVLEMIKQPRTNELHQRLLQYRCPSTQNEIINVCCPFNIRSHKNFNLLDDETCGDIYSGDKIQQGKEAALSEFPWMALLGYNSSQKRIQWNCGGTLINDRYILTAAHCIAKDLVRIRLGEHNISNSDIDCTKKSNACAEPVQDIGIEETIVHPNYIRRNSEILHDIALIRLKQVVRNSYSVSPICLPVDNVYRNMEFTSNLTITGWGVTEHGIVSDVLLKVNVPYKNGEECSKSYEVPEPQKSVRIGRTHLCAGGVGGADSCVGDSGGPMQQIFDGKYIQFGIVSFGPKVCGSDGIPGVYTKVSHYMTWILDNMKS